MKLYWVLLKYDDDLVFFCSDLVSFAQIWQKIQIAAKKMLRQHLHRLRSTINQIRSDLTCWFLRSVAGFLTKNSMSSSQLRVGYKLDLHRLVDTLTVELHFVIYLFISFIIFWVCFCNFSLSASQVNNL